MKSNSCFKEFIKYTLLSIFGTLGVSCYIFTDTLFISMGMGESGLTALNLAIPVYSFMYGFCVMMGVGGGTRYAIARGEGSAEKADEIFTSTLTAGLLVSFVFMAAGLLFSSPLARILGADSAVFEMTDIYLKLLLSFTPAFLINNTMAGFVRNDGAPRLAMTATLTGSLSNVLLDYIFIFPLNMGMTGAVLATVLSPIISICVLSLHIIKKHNNFHFRMKDVRFFTAISCAATGTSAFVNEVANAAVVIVFNLLILDLLGNTGVAAYGVIANLAIVAVAVMSGISQGMQPIISRSYGEGNRLYIKRTLRYGIIFALALSAVIYGVILIFPEPITEIFNSEKSAELQGVAVNGLRLYFSAIPFAAFNIIICNYFAAMKMAMQATVISLLKGLLLLIPAAVLLSFFGGIDGVWLSYFAAEAVTAGVSLGLVIGFGRRKGEW